MRMDDTRRLGVIADLERMGIKLTHKEKQSETLQTLLFVRKVVNRKLMDDIDKRR